MTGAVTASVADHAVRRLGDLRAAEIAALLARYGLSLACVADDTSIPGSYWGDEEAGLRGTTLYARRDTPLHSILHETSHFVCMPPARRAILDTDAGGDYLEECAVCYLQILLAEGLPGVGGSSMLADMDRWGYTFRLGSARRWFERDAEDACAWLQRYGLIDARRAPTWRLRV